MNFNAEEKQEIKQIKQDLYPLIDETLEDPERYLSLVFNNLVLQISDSSK